MSQSFSESAVYMANVMYHESESSVRSIARQLGCSWYAADRLIVYSRDKWEERLRLSNNLPLHFDECLNGGL